MLQLCSLLAATSKDYVWTLVRDMHGVLVSMMDHPTTIVTKYSLPYWPNSSFREEVVFETIWSLSKYN